MRTAPKLEHVDLTSRARIRNAALRLFAQQGVSATPLRAIAAEAGVTVGLIPHHFGSKEGLHHEVEEWVVAQFANAIAHANQAAGPQGADPAARDAAVERMLNQQPVIVDFLRRELFYPEDTGVVLDRLVGLAQDGLEDMRKKGFVSSKRDSSDQVVDMLVRQLGKVFMQPLVDRFFTHATSGDDTRDTPQVIVELRKR